MGCCTLPTIVQAFSETKELALEAQKLELAVELLRSVGTIRLRALGTSMLPAIWPDDVLHIERRQPDELAAGDVVLVKLEKSVVIHRLLRNEGPQWITRGDAVAQDDPSVAPENILGRVAKIQRRDRIIECKRRIRLAQRGLAWMLCHSRICRTAALRAHSVWCERDPHEVPQVSFDPGSSQST